MWGDNSGQHNKKAKYNAKSKKKLTKLDINKAIWN